MPDRLDSVEDALSRSADRPLVARLRPLLALSLALPLGARAEVLRLVGSDLIGEPVVALLEQQAADYEQRLVLDFAGTRPALDRLPAGDVAMAVLADPGGQPKLPPDWQSVPLGYVTAFIIVPAGLPVEQIGVEELARVFGADSAVASLRWGELGGTGAWAAVPVTPLVTTAAEGLAAPLFRRVVLEDGDWKPAVRLAASAALTLEAAAREAGALAVVPRPPGRDHVLKALRVADRGEAVAFGATPENLHAGDYPFRLPVHLAFPRGRAGELLPWLRLWHGEPMAEALLACGVVPVPLPVRNQQVLDLELLE